MEVFQEDERAPPKHFNLWKPAVRRKAQRTQHLQAVSRRRLKPR
jgi:hypothetical protein